MHKLCRHSPTCQSPILCAVFLVSQNLCGQYLNDFYIFLARKYALFGHSAYCCNHYGRLSHLREKYGKPSPRFCRFSLCGNTNFHRMLFLDNISQHNGKYRMIAFYWYVLCIGILLSWHANDVMFLGCRANFETRKNYATGTMILFIIMCYHQVFTYCIQIFRLHPLSPFLQIIGKIFWTSLNIKVEYIVKVKQVDSRGKNALQQRMSYTFH